MPSAAVNEKNELVKSPLGWSSTTALLLILGGVILLVLGLIGEYIGRIFMCVNASPQYVERSVVKRDGAP